MKKTKLVSQKSLLLLAFFVFFAPPKRQVDFMEKLCAHITYEDVHMIFFFFWSF
jgi:hypothetical protein